MLPWTNVLKVCLLSIVLKTSKDWRSFLYCREKTKMLSVFCLQVSGKAWFFRLYILTKLKKYFVYFDYINCSSLIFSPKWRERPSLARIFVAKGALSYWCFPRRRWHIHGHLVVAAWMRWIRHSFVAIWLGILIFIIFIVMRWAVYTTCNIFVKFRKSSNFFGTWQTNSWW